MTERDDNVYKAKLAEQAERYDGTTRERRRLKKGAVPSSFQWTKPQTPSCLARTARAKDRDVVKNLEPSFDVGLDLMEQEVGYDSDAVVLPDREDIVTSACDTQTQTLPLPAKWSIVELSANKKMLHYYSGLNDYETFSFALSTLGKGAYCLNYRGTTPRNISAENQFLLTLVKLRRHTPNLELAYNFGVCEKTVSNIFVTWINFMYCKWQKLNLWPSRDLVRFYNPTDFKRLYPSTRVILDGVEFPIQKPKNPRAQQITYSTYKNRNTLKSVPGITPGGLVSFIPPAFGGSTSDRMFVERTHLVDLCDPKDSIMVDKGFDVQDIFATRDITVNIPTFLKKGNQFSVVELTKDRKIASKRVHVERVIGLAKTYKILCTPLNDIETVLGSRIQFVCFMLCNMRPCIVPTNA